VVLSRGTAWDDRRLLADQAGFTEHVAFVTDLLDRGTAIEAGPFADPSLLGDDDLIALALLDIGSVAEAETLFAGDPLVIAEVVSAHVYPWGDIALRRASD
jgi:uncharacterized protein YciI